jgi:hypothetical protein
MADLFNNNRISRDKTRDIFSARQLSSYCPAVVATRRRKATARAERRRRRKENVASCWLERRGRRACLAREERRCGRMRRRLAADHPRQRETCSQGERDRAFGKDWRWNTRNCDSLTDSAEVKKCKRSKRKRCLQRQTKDNALSDSEAREACRRKNKNKVKVKKLGL